MPKLRVLMVCRGNFCRSPIAEAVFADHINKAGLTDRWEVDSAATSDVRLGEPPHEYSIAVLDENGITNYSHHARQISDADFHNFNWILAMDSINIEDLEELQPKSSNAKIELLGSYDPNGEPDIWDPQTRKELDKVYERCVRSVKSFLQKHSSS